MVHVVSVWVGDKYGPEYPHILHDSICRHLGEEQTHWCLTDRPDELPEGVTAIPANPDLPGWWQKVYLFSPDMPWRDGERVLYMDLDVCVTGRLEGLSKGIIRDWNWPCYNSSVMCWDAGEHRQIWTSFGLDEIDNPTRTLQGLLPKGQVNGGDQEWITEVSSWDVFPRDLFLSYRAIDWPPASSKAVIFHGKPKPDEVSDGWVKDVWKVGGLTALPEMKGMNVSHDYAHDNVRRNVQRDLEWFTGFGERKGAAVIVCGGPSLKESVQAIKNHKRRGARIVCVNNALSFLMQNRIKPDAHVMLDARPENVVFVQDAPKGVRYFLASQVHPDVFDALEGHEVVVWHNAMGDGEELMEILAPWFDEGPNQKPVVLVPGGCTVGLRAINLVWLSGYRNIHVYGMDGSYEDEHHAYAQPMNDGEAIQWVKVLDKTYKASRWMVRQAMEFQEQYLFLKDKLKLTVHGRGLIPDMWRGLQ